MFSIQFSSCIENFSFRNHSFILRIPSFQNRINHFFFSITQKVWGSWITLFYYMGWNIINSSFGNNSIWYNPRSAFVNLTLSNALCWLRNNSLTAGVCLSWYNSAGGLLYSGSWLNSAVCNLNNFWLTNASNLRLIRWIVCSMTKKFFSNKRL